MSAKMAPHPVYSLAFITFGIIILGIVGALLWHLRKPSNRNSMENTPERGEPGAPDKPRGEPL